MAERVKACPPFRHVHCVEPGIVSSIPFAASWSCPGCMCEIKIVLVVSSYGFVYVKKENQCSCYCKM